MITTIDLSNLKYEITDCILYCVPLEKSLGYGYVKYLRYFSAEKWRIGFHLIKVYAYHSQTIEKNPHLEEYLIPPICVFGKPAIRGEYKWYKIKKETPIVNDHQVPMFRSAIFRFQDIHFKEASVDWYLIKNFDLNGKILLPYKDLCHLGYFHTFVYPILTHRITMEYIRFLGLQMEDYYEEKELKRNGHLGEQYLIVKNTCMYNDIPFEKRDFHPHRFI